jgi:hypothetical protein
MNSLADAAFTQAAFSFVPPSLIDRAVTFHQGEALIAGKISPQPALLRFGTRITEEGGADVALAENLIRARQAACSYSWRIPPRRCRLRMSRWAIWSRSMIGGGSGRSGRALAMP